MGKLIRERLHDAVRVLHRQCSALCGGPAFVHHLDHPFPSDLFVLNMGFRGWISSRRKVVGVAFSGVSREDASVRLVRRDDVEWAMAYRYRYHVGFESDVPIRTWLGDKRIVDVTMTVHFDAGAPAAIPLSLKSEHDKKANKLSRYLPILRCPECHSILVRSGATLECRTCHKDYSLSRNMVNFLTEGFVQEYSIEPTYNVSKWDYDDRIMEIIRKNPDKLYLDCGAGLRKTYYENVINYEIVDYSSTDVLGVGEKLPFADNSLDGVFSVAVLEHVKDPFRCAKEISRVLKPGGVLFCAVPFLQPRHGYPHHYYNMTDRGLANLFPDLSVTDQYVPLSLHPIQAIRWILYAYARGLSRDLEAKFVRLTVKDIFDLPQFDQFYVKNFPLVHKLDKEKWTELAAGNCLVAHKK